MSGNILKITPFQRSGIEINPPVPGFTNESILGFLWDVVTHVKPRFAVEIGSFFGRSSHVISEAQPEGGKLLCVDVWNNVFDDKFRALPFMQTCMSRCGEDIRQMYSQPKLKTFGDCFQLTLSRFPHMQQRVDTLQIDSRKVDFAGYPDIEFAYIDGDHSYEGVRNDFLKVAPHLVANAVVVFDDYYDDFPGVQRFINELRALPGVLFYGQQDHDIGFCFQNPKATWAALQVAHQTKEL